MPKILYGYWNLWDIFVCAFSTHQNAVLLCSASGLTVIHRILSTIQDLINMTFFSQNKHYMIQHYGKCLGRDRLKNYLV